jgi:hypothetical protein
MERDEIGCSHIDAGFLNGKMNGTKRNETNERKKALARE